MEEKRTAIELVAVKERLKQADVDLKWVDGEQELADGLTKPSKHEPLIKALDRSEWRIIYDPAFQSAKCKRALGIQNVDLIHWLHCLFALEHWARRKLHRCWNGTYGCSIAINKCLSKVSCSELTAQITPLCSVRVSVKIPWCSYRVYISPLQKSPRLHAKRASSWMFNATASESSWRPNCQKGFLWYQIGPYDDSFYTSGNYNFYKNGLTNWYLMDLGVMSPVQVDLSKEV